MSAVKESLIKRIEKLNEAEALRVLDLCDELQSHRQKSKKMTSLESLRNNPNFIIPRAGKSHFKK